MKTIRRFFGLLALLSLTVVFACKDHDPKSSGEFSSGVVVVNEGNFNSSDGTLSHFDPSNSEVKLDIFGTSNAGKALGDVVQSMTVNGDKGYIVVNGDGKLIVVNSNTLELIQTISGFGLPRYFIVYNGKGYLTEWVNFSDAGRVSIINLETNEVEGTIPVGFGAENLIAVNDKIYVSNNFEGTISVIDPVQKVVVSTIPVGSSPGGLVTDKNGMLWVMCGGGYDQDYAPLNDGALQGITLASNVMAVNKPLGVTTSAKVAINKSRDQLFYMVGNQVFTLRVEGSLPALLVTEPGATAFYGIGIDPDDEVLYVGDSKGFASNGTVYRYDLSGVAKGSFPAGRGPNGFVFR